MAAYIGPWAVTSAEQPLPRDGPDHIGVAAPGRWVAPTIRGGEFEEFPSWVLSPLEMNLTRRYRRRQRDGGQWAWWLLVAVPQAASAVAYDVTVYYSVSGTNGFLDFQFNPWAI